MTEQQLETLRNQLKEHFRAVRGTITENSKGLDNVIFVLSTGIFVLSINYLTGLKDNVLEFPQLLIWSWIFLAGAIIAHVISYKVAIKCGELIQEKLNAWGLRGFMPVHYKPDNDDDTKKQNKLIIMLNDTALYLTIVGVILLLVFASINFWTNNLVNKAKQKTEKEEKTSVINNYYYTR